MVTLKTCTAFLSTSTNSRHQKMWRVMVRDQPICADTPSLQRALAAAKQVLGCVTLAVWDGDKGEWTKEIATAG